MSTQDPPVLRARAGTMSLVVGLLVVLEAVVFLLAAAMHAGLRVPVGIAEPRIVPAAIVEGVIGLGFAAAALAVFAGSSRAWAVTTAAHAIAVAGILLGMVALASGRGPRTEANDLYHRVTLVVSAAVLLFLLTPVGKLALGGTRS